MSSKRKRQREDDENVDKKPRQVSVIDEEDSDMDMSQNPDFHYGPTMATEAEVGIIEQVAMKNFMCHNILEVKFGPQVNFVIGRNGSGKSAVLTALVVGLGGKANITNRGTAIKSFIKTGKLSSEVVVKLRNRGQDAYKPDSYGESIIVERKITKDTSSYRLKSAQGKVISTKREELSHILDNFNIQVDNPIVVLNQDTSRNFLHSKSPNDKYKFFLKATQLEQIKLDYIKANESKEVAVEIIKQKQQTLPVLEKEVGDWEQKYKALTSLKELKTKMDRLRNELVWALICEREKGLEPVSRQLRTEEARTPKFRKKVEESEQEVLNNQTKYTEIEKELETLSASVAQVEPNYTRERQEKEQLKKLAKNINVEVRKIQRDLNNLKKDKDQIIERISQIQNSAQQNFETERNARLEKIKKLEGHIEELSAMKKTTGNDLEQYHGAVTKLKRDQIQCKSEQDDINRNLHNMKRHLQDLEASKSNRLRRFGSYVPKLIETISEAHSQGKFHQKPIGPIGAHFSLKDQRWALAVETAVKGLIFAFCVHDHHDESQLEKIMNKVCPEGKKPSTITSQFQRTVYDVSKNRPETNNYPTILEVLDIKDPVIANCLIDQRGIESILLIKDQDESRTVMSRHPPKRAREAFNMDGDQIHSNPFRYYSGSTDKVKILVSSVEDDIRHNEQEMEKYEDKARHLREQANRLTRELSKNQQEERKSQSRIMKLQEQIGKQQMELDELRNIEEPTPVDVETLETEVVRLDEQSDKLQVEVTIKQDAHNEATSKFMAAEAKFIEHETEMRTISEKADTIRHQLALAENQITTAKSRQQHYVDKMKAHEKTISDLKKRLDDYQKELDEEMRRAEQICERLRTKRSSQNLESEIKQIGKQITAEEKNRGNYEEITKNYARTKEAFLAIRKEVAQLTNFLKGLSKVMKHRQVQYLEFRHMIAARSKFFFTVTLSTRKYSGRMVFDHKKEMLELNVQPTLGAQETSKDMRALSGGERSFSTVCFILSLWDAMESPFRCLDEFDVFMDMVNRRISMDMMMNVAQTQKGRQFIFLTPQDMSQVGIDPSMVRIFQMRAPERGQGTLPFRPVNQNDEDDEDMGAPPGTQ